MHKLERGRHRDPDHQPAPGAPPARHRDPGPRIYAHADLSLLATHVVQQARGRVSRPHQALSADILDALQEHEWRGNVWELKHFCQQLALVLGSEPVTPSVSPACC